MKKFLLRTSGFLLILLLLIIIGFFLPATPYASQSLLFSERHKDSLLMNVEQPRVIFVGGSNLSFGIDSKMVKDSLHLNPINTGIHTSIGLKYMMDNTLQHIQKGDIVILVPEYILFYRDYNYMMEELVRMITDVNKSNYKLFSTKQFMGALRYIPKTVLSRFNPLEYKMQNTSVYGIDSFNEYGDACTHWSMEKQPFNPFVAIDENALNEEVLLKIKQFQTDVANLGGVVYLSFPGYQTTSFLNSEGAIKKMEKACINEGITILGTPERYMIPDSLLFNSPYHLNRQGVTHRTLLIIEDLKTIMQNNSDCPSSNF